MELLERELPKQKLCTWRAKVVAAHIWALLGIQNIFQNLRNFSVQKFPSSPRWSSFMMLGSHISNKGFFVTVSSPNCTMSCWVLSCCCCCVIAVEKLIWQPHATWISTYSIWCSVLHETSQLFRLMTAWEMDIEYWYDLSKDSGNHLS